MAKVIDTMRALLVYAGILATLGILTYAGGLKVLTLTGNAIAGARPVVEIAVVSAKSTQLHDVNGTPKVTYALELQLDDKYAGASKIRKTVSKQDYLRYAVGARVKVRHH